MINKKIHSIVFGSEQEARLATLRNQLSKSVLSSAGQYPVAEQACSAIWTEEQSPDRIVNKLLNARIRKVLNNSLGSAYKTVIG